MKSNVAYIKDFKPKIITLDMIVANDNRFNPDCLTRVKNFIDLESTYEGKKLRFQNYLLAKEDYLLYRLYVSQSDPCINKRTPNNIFYSRVIQFSKKVHPFDNKSRKQLIHEIFTGDAIIQPDNDLSDVIDPSVLIEKLRKTIDDYIIQISALQEKSLNDSQQIKDQTSKLCAANYSLNKVLEELEREKDLNHQLQARLSDFETNHDELVSRTIKGLQDENENELKKSISNLFDKKNTEEIEALRRKIAFLTTGRTLNGKK